MFDTDSAEVRNRLKLIDGVNVDIGLIGSTMQTNNNLTGIDPHGLFRRDDSYILPSTAVVHSTVDSIVIHLIDVLLKQGSTQILNETGSCIRRTHLSVVFLLLRGFDLEGRPTPSTWVVSEQTAYGMFWIG